MTSPGQPRHAAPTSPSPPVRRTRGWARLRPRSRSIAIVEALAMALVAAVAWALLKGILELGPGLLAVAALGGWAIGAILWQVRAQPLLAAVVATLAWVASLVLTWLLAMAILPGSSRTLLERIEGTPFLDWLAPQFGVLEVAGLAVYVAAALYGARPRSGADPRPDGGSA